MTKYVFTPPATVAVPVVGSDELFPVRRIYCVGRNYLDHVREMGADDREPPFFFQKPTDSIVLNSAEIPYPPGTTDFQYELELVMAIGKGGSNISIEDADSHVYGLASGIDLTRRDVQINARKMGRPWEIGKSFDMSAPIGDIVPRKGKLPSQGKIQLTVNGVVKQSADVSQLIWNCKEIIAQLSTMYRLEPGDLIYTGTPAGVGPVVTGDTIVASVEGLPDVTVKII